MPAPAPAPRLPGRLHGALALWLTLLLTGALTLVHAPEAAAASSKKKSGKKKSSKKKKSKKVANKPTSVLPLSREVDGPTGVTSGGDLLEEEAEEDDPDADGETEGSASAESELAAIERELLANPPDLTLESFALPPVISDPKPIVHKPGFIKHQIIPAETLAEIATRYGVSEQDIARWNHLNVKKPVLHTGKTLRIRVTDPPPARERIEHVAKRGDDWDSLAKEYGVDVLKLKAWNRKLGTKITSKEKVVLWRDPPPIVEVTNGGLAAKLAQVRVRAGGISIGRPSRGRLVRGVELPDRPDLYVRRKPDESYGSTHAIKELMGAIVRFRHETGFKRSIVIGGISRAKGGRFRPHKSHQSGRDIDIRMPLTAAAEGKRHITANDIDWRATWQLIHAFIRNGQVEYVFLEYKLQKRLYKAARETGVPQEQLAEWIQWPRPPKTNKGIVRHVQGHQVHFHVRVRCAPTETHCVTAR